jgi:CHAD domain-containing protein
MDQRFAVEGVGARTPLGEAAPALLLTKADPLFKLESAAAGGADMDAVHDMRVASRRLREVMRLLAPVYPSKEFRAWYKRVRRITRALGPVRDADVFIDDFTKMLRDLGPGGSRAVAFMVGYRMGLRERELEALNDELAKLDLATSRKAFARLGRSASDSPEAASPLAAFAHAAVAERAATVFGAQPAAMDEAHMLQQHALRIDYKRLRYAVEAFAPCYGDDFDDLHDTLTSFQDVLGDLHDLHLFIDLLHDPERVSAANRAGVSQADLEEVAAVLARRAHEKYVAFRALADAHPPAALLPQLLLPLTRVPEESAAPAVPEQGGAILVEATLVGDGFPDAEPDAGVPTVDLARVPVVPPVAPGAEPWSAAFERELDLPSGEPVPDAALELPKLPDAPADESAPREAGA